MSKMGGTGMGGSNNGKKSKGKKDSKEMPMMEECSKMMGDGDFKPWDMCKVMKDDLQELKKTNKKILEELKRK